MLKLSDESKDKIERVTGLSFDYIVNDLTFNEEMDMVERLAGSPPVFSKRKEHSLLGSGNPYLAANRFATMEETNAKLGVGEK